MEQEENETKNATPNYCEAAKGARVYELILDGKNLNEINESEVDKIKFEEMDFNNFFAYTKTLKVKSDRPENKIDSFTNQFKVSVNVIINETTPESSELKIITELLKLSAYYWLYKLQNSKNTSEEDDYINKIDEKIDELFKDKKYYYNILTLINVFENGEEIANYDKYRKFEIYLNMLFYLNEKMFVKLIESYMNEKKVKYSQYNIELPIISFSSENVYKKIEEIHNILLVLFKTESFKTNERFEYFYGFRYKYNLLDQINYVLSKQNKKILISLDKCDDEITTEAIEYSLYYFDNSRQKEDVISELQTTIEEEKKKKNEFHARHELLKKQYKHLNEQYENLNEQYEKLSDDYSKNINELELKVISLKQNSTNNKQTINQQDETIKALKNNIKEKDEIIERISYREVGSRIIKFFSFSQPKDIINKYIENDISPTNINKITKYIKTNLSYYYQYLKNSGVDLTYVLKEIKKEKKCYDFLVHDSKKNKKKYNEIMTKRDKQIEEKINFIFSKSKLMQRFVFDKDESITEDDIFNEFKDLNEKLKGNEEEQKKNAEEKP